MRSQTAAEVVARGAHSIGNRLMGVKPGMVLISDRQGMPSRVHQEVHPREAAGADGEEASRGDPPDIRLERPDRAPASGRA